ncbi:MAG: DUF4440 domain-containing protein [bacterium]|nr:DUF4440 domain-containing protein [bacterium]
MNNRYRTRIPVLLALLLVVMRPAAWATDLIKEREAVADADLDLCQTVADHDVERFKARIAPDARFLAATVAHGPEEVAKAWAEYLDPGSGKSLQWGSKEVTVASAGDLAYTIGEFLYRARDQGGVPVALTGTYLSVWTRAENGRWLITMDGSLTAREPMPPGFSLERRNRFAARWAPLAPGGGISHHRQPQQSQVSASGDLAYTFGEYTVRASDAAGKSDSTTVAYFTVWARVGEGPWKAVAESGLSSRPVAKGSHKNDVSSPDQRHLAELRALGNGGREFARSVETDDVELFKSRVAPDAYFLGSRVTTHGPREVAGAWAPYLDPTSGRELYWEPREVFVAASADLGYTIGDWVEIGPRADGKPGVETGQYVSVWRKNEQGRWQNTADVTLTVRDPLPEGFRLERQAGFAYRLAPVTSPQAAISHQRKPWQVGFSAAGDFAYAVGEYVDQITDVAGKTHRAAGTFVTVWRREGSGPWKAVAEGLKRPLPRQEE